MDLPKLRQIDYTLQANPLLEPETVSTRRRYVQASRHRNLVDLETGEVSAVASIHTLEERDDAEFVKIFADGVKALYSLSRAAYRVFQAILDEYQRAPMTGGYADTLHLIWFDGGLCGRDIGMSESTFNRGLRELIAKRFLAGKMPGVYWINPHLFFKGDRVAFIREYRRRQPTP